MSSCPVRYLGLKRERHSCHIRPGSIYRHWYHPHCKHSGAGYTQNQSHPHPRQIGSYRQIARKRQRHVDCKSVNILAILVCILKKKRFNVALYYSYRLRLKIRSEVSEKTALNLQHCTYLLNYWRIHRPILTSISGHGLATSASCPAGDHLIVQLSHGGRGRGGSQPFSSIFPHGLAFGLVHNEETDEGEKASEYNGGEGTFIRIVTFVEIFYFTG